MPNADDHRQYTQTGSIFLNIYSSHFTPFLYNLNIYLANRKLHRIRHAISMRNLSIIIARHLNTRLNTWKLLCYEPFNTLIVFCDNSHKTIIIIIINIGISNNYYSNNKYASKLLWCQNSSSSLRKEFRVKILSIFLVS